MNFTKLPAQGLYLIAETTAPKTQSASDQVVSMAMITGTPYTADGKTYATVSNGKTDYELGKLYLKAEKVVLTKTVSHADELAATGSVRTFTISANVPDYADYATWNVPDCQSNFAYGQSKYCVPPTFMLKDSAASNVNIFDGDTVSNLKVVMVGTDANGGKTEQEVTNYYVGVNPSDLTKVMPLQLAGGDTKTTTEYQVPAHGFTIYMEGLDKYSGDQMQVTYDATVTDASNETTNNTATLAFSNDSGQTDDHFGGQGMVSAAANVYTASIPFDKVAFDNAKLHLDGAQFTVTQGDAKTPVLFDYNEATHTYNVDPNGKMDKITSYAGSDGAEGGVSIAGLAADSTAPVVYTFTETKAPAGYVLGEKPVSFTLTGTPQADSSTKAVGSVSFKTDSSDFANFVDLTDDAVVTAASLKEGTTLFAGGVVRVENTMNASDFAKTGGQITIVLVVVAVLVLVGALFMVLAAWRRRAARVTEEG